MQELIEFVKIQVFFQGALWIMFFYNLLFGTMLRDRAYIYYAFYILCMSFVSLDFRLFKETPPSFLPLLTNFAALFITILYAQFIRYFLNIAQINAKINHYFNYWVYVRCVFILIVMGLHIKEPENALSNKFVLSVFITDIIWGLYLIYVAWKTNRILATYIVLGYLAMTLPLSIVILQQIIFGENPNADNEGIFVQVGVLIELVLFSLGLGYRSKVAEKEKLAVAEENRQIIAQQNTVLEQKVSIRTEELNLTLQTVEKQRDNIISSINYALRIQNAILPKEQEIQKHFPESFVLFKPKDIVSGDFYWFADKGERKIIVVADCTGHGVSGAFMTMIGNNILNQIVHDQEITQPNEILNLMTPLLEKTLLHSEGKVKDGMDISIVAITETLHTETLQGLQDLVRFKVEYAGAMNPLYYVPLSFGEGQGVGLQEIKADKVPIGGKAKEGFSYKNYELESTNYKTLFNDELEITNYEKNHNDVIRNSQFVIQNGVIRHSSFVIYLCTDGFQDQFGGTENRKFMVGKFKKLLLEISEKPITEQKQILETTISNWIAIGNETQTDDICVLGIKI